MRFTLTLGLISLVARAIGQTDPSTEDIYNIHLPPVNFNCTESLTEVMLQRQEFQVENTVAIVKEILVAMKHSPRVKCSTNYENVANLCLSLTNEMDWQSAKVHCENLGGHLVTFKDANQFAAVIAYVKTLNLTENVWIGGHISGTTGKWKWVTGEDMPMGTPFWGTYQGDRQPRNDGSEPCGILNPPDDWMIHDTKCHFNYRALCQAK